MKRWYRWWWIFFLIPIAVGFFRLRFNADVLDLLPSDIRAVEGLKLYQQQFSNSRELIVTLQGPDAATTDSAAKVVAEHLRSKTDLITDVTWQPPWDEHPELTTELIAHLWLNQPPEILDQLADKLAETNLPAVLAATREQLTTTLSPTDIAQLSYDPFGFTRLPESVVAAAPKFGEGNEVFASPDGTFRLLFIRSAIDLPGYRECTDWLETVKQTVTTALAEKSLNGIALGYTGRPAFVAEISASMKRDIILSVGGTSLFIAILFWFAHRRYKPMLWLLTLLALVLVGTLGLGGLIFGTISVVSMGFAAILLGLAVDYAVVHYQEALAHPDLSVPQIRRAIAPSIFWAAVTTITAFLVLNFGGLPGLAQLGSLVGVGVALSAFVMIFAFLPPLFPDRWEPKPQGTAPDDKPHAIHPLNPLRAKSVFVVSVLIVLSCIGILAFGLPKMDASANALQPRDSQAYTTLDAITHHLTQNNDPLWLIIKGADESEVARRLDAVEPVLKHAVADQIIAGYQLPTTLWPRPEFQAANRPTIEKLISERETLRAAMLSGGFTPDAFGLVENIFGTWQTAIASTNVFWPTNKLNTWIFEKMSARSTNGFYVAGFLQPTTNQADLDAAFIKLESELPHEGVWLSSWKLLGHTVLAAVKKNMWKLLLPMVGLVLLSLWFAFRRFAEIFLSISILLLSGLCLLAVMKLMGWSWNLLNLMALPLILGTGVDYSIFMQLALRRYHGDLHLAHRSVGRALLLCGGTAVSGFGSLALSSNAGMSSLGQVCAVGIGANMLFSVFLLPVWWKVFCGRNSATNNPPSTPSSLYGAKLWSLGLTLTRLVPAGLCVALARMMGGIYWKLAPHRREVVVQNLLPVVNNDRPAAEQAAKKLFQNFAVKIVDLLRSEGGASLDSWKTEWHGWNTFLTAYNRGKGMLLVTPHLGDWEFGGTYLAKHDFKLLVLTQAEPDQRLTELRQKSRTQRGVQTLVVGEDAFAFVEIIKRLQEGAVVALLLDRPPPPTGVSVELFGQPFQASIAAAELARASGCAIIPAYVVHRSDGYWGEILPEITYDRATIGDRASRIRLTQEIMRAFEPAIRQHPDQWYHFVPIWPKNK